MMGQIIQETESRIPSTGKYSNTKIPVNTVLLTYLLTYVRS
jgi:hypothetical protein